MADPVWFWQRIVSPHMAGLAEALAATGRPVTYVAEQEMSEDRAAQGWQAPQLGDANLRFAPTAEAIRGTVQSAPADSIHICQGFRGNGLVGVAQQALASRGLRQWVIMETVEDAGWRGLVKRLEYGRLVRRWLPQIQGVLATGHSTAGWLIERGLPAGKVFPFAYFLPDTTPDGRSSFEKSAPFRFLFVGQFIKRKGIDLLLSAMHGLERDGVELMLAGSGPIEAQLRSQAEEESPGCVHWLGRRPIGEIPALMASADCLVLPSRHDGWGAVVSEALMAGTPAICSDRCGAAGVVRASGCGGVFATGDAEALLEQLRKVTSHGRQTPERRAALADWAQCLGVKAGSDYLSAIFCHSQHAYSARPAEPWRCKYSA